MSNKTFLSSLWLWSYFKNWRQTTKRLNAITDAFFIPNVPNFPFVLFSLLSFKAGLLATSSLSFSSSENVFISSPAWEAFHWIENSELTPALSTLNVPAMSFRPPEFLEWQDSIIWNVPVQVVFHFSLATFKMPLVFNSLRSVWASMSLGSLSLLGGFSAVISEVFKSTTLSPSVTLKLISVFLCSDWMIALICLFLLLSPFFYWVSPLRFFLLRGVCSCLIFICFCCPFVDNLYFRVDSKCCENPWELNSPHGPSRHHWCRAVFVDPHVLSHLGLCPGTLSMTWREASELQGECWHFCSSK